MRGYTYFIGVGLGDAAVPDHFLALAHELVNRGHNVVLLSWGKGTYEVQTNQTDLQVYRWPSPRPTHLKDAIFLYRLIKQYKPVCLIGNFGAVNVMMVTGWLTHVPCRAAWYHGLSGQISLDWQRGQWHKQVLRLRKRAVYHLTTHMVCNSIAAIADLCTAYGVPKSKCFYFYNSLPDPGERYAPYTYKQEELLVCAGRLFYSKGQDTLLDAVAKLRGEGIPVRVKFLGDGPTRNQLMFKAGESGVGDICEFIGHVAHEEVLKNMAGAAMTIVPSRDEAFGYVAIESMAVGTPVIASRVGGLAEVVRDGMDGYLVPPEDFESLANKIKLLLGDAELRRKMGQNARERFLETFEQSKIIHAQADWFEQIVANSIDGEPASAA